MKAPPRGALDFVAAALCVWAAVYHTPAGALARTGLAKLTGSRTSARPLLSYYSGGIYDAQPVAQAPRFRPPPGDALGRGVYSVASQLTKEQREVPQQLAQRYELPFNTADDAAKLLARAKKDLGDSEDAAVLALFAGYDVASYAVSRTGATRLEALALQLPPSSAGAVDRATSALMLGRVYSLTWPVPEGTRVSSPFGYRTHPVLGTQKLHTGVDLAVPVNTPVHATADGVVRRASEDDVNGRVVIIDHGHGVTTAYCHNQTLLVSVGQRVKAGEVVARSGNTGRSTGPHLHYQLALGGKPSDALGWKERGGPGRFAPVLNGCTHDAHHQRAPRAPLGAAAAEVPDASVRRYGPAG